MGLNGWSFENLKLNPMAGGSAATLTTLGAVDYDKVVNGHQWWRIVAASFVCSGQLSATSAQQANLCSHQMLPLQCCMPFQQLSAPSCACIHSLKAAGFDSLGVWPGKLLYPPHAAQMCSGTCCTPSVWLPSCIVVTLTTVPSIEQLLVTLRVSFQSIPICLTKASSLHAKHFRLPR